LNEKLLAQSLLERLNDFNRHTPGAPPFEEKSKLIILAHRLLVTIE